MLGLNRRPFTRKPHRGVVVSNRRCRAFTLLEVIMVIMIMAVLAALVIPDSDPSLFEKLQGMARIVATDLAYGRSLAVGNNDSYSFTWDAPNNRYILTYSGTNQAMATLPSSPFSLPTDPPTQHIVDLDDLPQVGPPVYLLGVIATSGTTSSVVTSIQYGPLGGTTSSSTATIWLQAGRGAGARYITVQINPTTGTTVVGTVTNVGPPASLLQTH
jgi:prepilin-type N-terminal cleavage/methylation domain-containing protein